jgi:probable addiction module antidote protein
MPRNLNYRDDLLEDLRNSADFAAAYLSAAKADSTEAFLVALRDVAEARKGMTVVAKETDLNREHLYRALSKDGNPRLSTVDAILDAIGMKSEIHPKEITIAAPPPGGGYSVTVTAASLMGATTMTTGSIVAQVRTDERQDYFSTPIENQTTDIIGIQKPTGNSQLARAA